MRPNEQEPTVEELEKGHGRDAKRYSHPAYGQISAHRSYGGSVALYGSDFRHNTSIEIEVKHSTFERSLARDWPHARGPIVRFSMSEAQWATFVSSLNSGDGVQCTLSQIGNEVLPAIAYRDAAAEHFGEVEDRIKDGLQSLALARAAIEECGLSRSKKDALLQPLNRAEMQLTSNAKFVVESHAKAMETRVEKAKIEVNAYVTGAVMRAGLAAISSGSAPLELPSPTNSTRPLNEVER